MKSYVLPHPIIESTFETLRQTQIQDKEELVNLLCKTDKLPSELWIYIVSFINNDDEYKAYLMFKTQSRGYQDTYYFFRGIKTDFDESMTKMKKEILEIQAHSRAIEDDFLDTPIDTYCPPYEFNMIYDDYNKCCVNKVNKCSSQWEYYVYDNAEELHTHYKNIIANGTDNAYYRRCEIKFI